MKTTEMSPAVPRLVKRLAPLLAMFVVGFIAAYLVLRTLSSPSPVRVEDQSASATINAAEIHRFLQLVEAEDYPAMEKMGNELFQPGAVVPDSGKLLDEYEVSSMPPHRVYALYTSIGHPASYRILLTLDGDRVASFLAEETRIAP